MSVIEDREFDSYETYLNERKDESFTRVRTFMIFVLERVFAVQEQYKARADAYKRKQQQQEASKKKLQNKPSTNFGAFL